MASRPDSTPSTSANFSQIDENNPWGMFRRSDEVEEIQLDLDGGDQSLPTISPEESAALNTSAIERELMSLPVHSALGTTSWDNLVQMVKTAKHSDECKTQWRKWCDKYSDGNYDPVRASREVLATFLTAWQYPSTSASASSTQRARSRSPRASTPPNPGVPTFAMDGDDSDPEVPAGH